MKTYTIIAILSISFITGCSFLQKHLPTVFGNNEPTTIMITTNGTVISLPSSNIVIK